MSDFSEVPQRRMGPNITFTLREDRESKTYMQVFTGHIYVCSAELGICLNSSVIYDVITLSNDAIKYWPVQ